MPLVCRALWDLIGIDALLQWESGPADRYREFRRRLALFAGSVVAVQLIAHATVAQYLVSREKLVWKNERLL